MKSISPSRLLILIPVLVCLLFITASCSKAPRICDGNDTSDYCRDLSVLKKIYSYTYSNSHAMETLEKLVTITPHRMTGTHHGTRAESFMYKIFSDMGIDVRYEPFTMRVWLRKKAFLKIRKNRRVASIDALSFAYTPEKSNVSGDIIDIGDGIDSDFEKYRDDIPGKIVLMNLQLADRINLQKKIKNPNRTYKSELAVRYGARGIIFVNLIGGGLLQTGTSTLDSGITLPIPSVCVSSQSGVKIREMLEPSDNSTDSGEQTQPTASRLTAAIDVESVYKQITARNIIATIKGESSGNGRIVFGAHLDTWDTGSGALDNGIGAVTVLETARLFKKLDMKIERDVEFILWSGEEHGLMGSKAYVRNRFLSGQINSIAFYVNIDMQGQPAGFDVEGREELYPFIGETASHLMGLQINFKGSHRSSPSAEPYSDYLPFMLMGIPVIQPVSGLPGYIYSYYHTRDDHIRLIKNEYLDSNVTVMGFLVYKLANLKKNPSYRMSVRQTEKMMLKLNGSKILIPEYNWQLRKSAE